MRGRYLNESDQIHIADRVEALAVSQKPAQCRHRSARQHCGSTGQGRTQWRRTDMPMTILILAVIQLRGVD